MNCPKCTSLNPDTSRFCNACGHEFSVSIKKAPPELFSDYSEPKISGTKIIALISAATFLLVAVFILMSPFYSVWRLSKAANDLDADTFSSYIDFTQLRSNLKSEIKAEMMTNMAKDKELQNNPFAGLAMLTVPTMVDNTVDTLVSPQGIEKAFREVREAAKQELGNAAVEESLKIARLEEVSWTMGYSGISEFYVDTQVEGGRGVTLLFERNWLVFWKLYNVKIRT
ncbi:MAG TPA: DUF2939 domain-containing protein [Aridibacter sp.]|nr:DUF2939 domain-containing protein [Aridibacter sp.]